MIEPDFNKLNVISILNEAKLQSKWKTLGNRLLAYPMLQIALKHCTIDQLLLLKKVMGERITKQGIIFLTEAPQEAKGMPQLSRRDSATGRLLQRVGEEGGLSSAILQGSIYLLPTRQHHLRQGQGLRKGQ